MKDSNLVLVLGGGGARGLAHLGVLEIFEREGLRPTCIVGSSMGGLVGALAAAGLSARDAAQLARGFRFPRWFVPGALVPWERIFRPAVPVLSGLSFDRLATPLAVTAVDLEWGSQVVLRHGEVLPALRATCAVPGVLAPVRLAGRWLVDGGLANVLPVDVAWAADPGVVVAVSVRGGRRRAVARLGSPINALSARLGTIIPTPGGARLSFEVLVRAAEIALERQATLVAAMAGPELLVEPDLKDIGLRDFDRLDDALAAGRQAAERALPALERLLATPAHPTADVRRAESLRVDPVCDMVVSAGRARASSDYAGRTYYFCSPNCRDAFEGAPERHLDRAGATDGADGRSHGLPSRRRGEGR